MLPANILKEFWDLPNNNVEDENDFALLKILLGLRDLLRVFLGRRIYIFAQNLKYNYIIDLEEGKQPLNLFIYNLSHKELKIL